MQSEAIHRNIMVLSVAVRLELLKGTSTSVAITAGRGRLFNIICPSLAVWYLLSLHSLQVIVDIPYTRFHFIYDFRSIKIRERPSQPGRKLLNVSERSRVLPWAP